MESLLFTLTALRPSERAQNALSGLTMQRARHQMYPTKCDESHQSCLLTWKGHLVAAENYISLRTTKLDGT